MSSSRLLTPLYLPSISILLQLTLATNPLFSDCPSSANFTANGPYNKNLNGLLSYLNSKTPLTGFGSGSLGMGGNMTYGSALCRGDINSTVCQACVDEASVEIQQVCQLKEQAILEQAAYVSPKLYAAGAMSVGTSMDLYGLAQCTGDLSSDDC
ncbi:cysteine-rich repeat secretory protein 1-like [Rhododendron vialii]|uniref:cysteine-rich repeat secretory protein 1-like n=1 Tax=Rhododendron vialii TaxID=182163 RepID=UPI00265F5439|nr:cysteine-rich repeat secretory protein 1-like [Rhododendron vialii]